MLLNFKALNRIDRLTAILIHLQSKKVVKAQEIADRFDISLRTVYRDIRSLEEAGVPVGAEAGKGYFMMEGYHLPPVMFTEDEASAFVTAEKLIEKFVDKSISKFYKSALFKIKSVLKDSEKQNLENLTSHIEVLDPPRQVGLQHDYMSLIQKATTQNKVLSVEYYSGANDEFTKRELEPIGICYYSMNWYLIAFCRMRNDYRNFRIDRMQKVQVKEQGFDRSQRAPLQSFIQNLISTSGLISIKVRFTPRLAKAMQEQKYYYGFHGQEEVGGKVEMSFLNSSIPYFAKWLLLGGKEVEIISPDEMRCEMTKLTEELKAAWL